MAHEMTEARIHRAAHLFASFEPWAARDRSREEGISDAEIATGSKLAEARRRERARIYSTYGDPAYGSYAIDHEDRERGQRIERAILDAHIAHELDPETSAAVPAITLEEKLVASIAIVNYRKGKVA